jgi:hypothetical protein
MGYHSRLLMLCAIAGTAQAFMPAGNALHGCLHRRAPAGRGGAASSARGGLLPHRQCLALRMSDEPSDKEMEELLKKRVELLKEKEELLKQRKEIVTQSNPGPVPELKRPKEVPMATAKRAEDLMSSANGNIFQGGNKKDNKDPKKDTQSDEGGLFGRRGFLRTLFVSFGFSVLTLVSAFVLSYPRLEKLAYVQFSALFENGSITLRKQLSQVR